MLDNYCTSTLHPKLGNLDKASIMVQEYWTNAPITNIMYKQIILFYRNNINRRISSELNGSIVQQLWKIICNEKSGSVALYIFEHVVFTVATIARNNELKKSNVYRVVKDLEGLGIVEMTQFKAVNPDPSYTGPKARFWKLTGFDLSDGWSNPLLTRAQVKYTTSVGVSPEYEREQSKQNKLLDISSEIMDYYVDKEQFNTFAPKPFAISAYIVAAYPELEPEYRAQLVQRVYNNLCDQTKFKIGGR
ncbi:MAG: hypothetical protein ACTSW1_17575 [Candidatus Hodarchaeales archaeon]